MKVTQELFQYLVLNDIGANLAKERKLKSMKMQIFLRQKNGMTMIIDTF